MRGALVRGVAAVVGAPDREGRVALQHRQHLVGEQAHVELGLLVRHAAEGELGHEVIDAGQRRSSAICWMQSSGVPTIWIFT